MNDVMFQKPMNVIPAKAGIQRKVIKLDSGLKTAGMTGNESLWANSNYFKE